MDTYGKRLAYALQSLNKPERDRAWLAAKLGITVQALSQVITGKTKALTSENHEAAVQALRCSGVWLATGHGEMLLKPRDGAMTINESGVDTFGTIGPTFEEAVRTIATRLVDADDATRRRAAGVLADIATEPEDYARLAKTLLAVIDTGKRRAA